MRLYLAHFHAMVGDDLQDAQRFVNERLLPAGISPERIQVISTNSIFCIAYFSDREVSVE